MGVGSGWLVGECGPYPFDHQVQDDESEFLALAHPLKEFLACKHGFVSHMSKEEVRKGGQW